MADTPTAPRDLRDRVAALARSAHGRGLEGAPAPTADEIDRAIGDVAPTGGRILADREAELLEVKGPCSDTNCRLHNAHRGPHDITDHDGGSR